MSSSDQALLDAWERNRSAQAFKALSARYAGMVYATCLRVLRNSHDAEDVTQDCFLALATVRKTPTGHLGPWLHRVATNRALDRIKTERHRKERESRVSAERPEVIEAKWDDISEYVDEAIGALPEKLRVAVVAHFLEEDTYEAIAQREGVSRSAIAQRTGRGIERIRESLRKKGVPIGASALTGIMSENIAWAQAVPASLSAELAKLAITGVGGELGAAAGARFAGFQGLTKGLAVGALVVVGLVATWGIWSTSENGAGETVSLPGNTGPAVVVTAEQTVSRDSGGEVIAVETDPPLAENVAQSSDGLRVTLPNGAWVELVGVSHYPARDTVIWWRPDGSILSEPPVEGLSNRRIPEWAAGKEILQFAIRYSCDPADGVAWLVSKRFTPHTPIHVSDGIDGDGETITGLLVVLADFPAELASADLNAAVRVYKTKPYWLSEILSSVAFKNIALSPHHEMNAEVIVAESTAGVPPPRSFDGVTFGAEVSFVLNDHRSGGQSFIDFDMGKTFSVPDDIAKLIAVRERERYGWGWNNLEGDPLAALLTWIEANGIDATVDFSEEHGQLVTMDMAVAEPINDTIAEQCWNSPAALAALLARVDSRSLGENRTRLVGIGNGKMGPWIVKTAGGASGMLRMWRGAGATGETVEILGKFLTNLPPEDEDVPELWITFLPYEEEMASLENLRLALQTDRSTTSRASHVSCLIEIRSSVDQRVALTARLPDSRGAWMAASVRDPSFQEQLKNMPAGSYLIAATREGVRCSNVVEVVIGADDASGDLPVLEAVALPPNPMRSVPYLGLRAVGPTPADPDLNTFSLMYATVVVDGIENIIGLKFGGMISPLEAGQANGVLLDLGSYTPRIDPETAGELVLRVGEYESDAINLIFEDPLAGQWRDDLSPATEAHVSLRGVVIGEDGELSVGHSVFLADESQRVFKGRYNADGEYEITDVPPGLYTFSCSPYRHGTPSLTIREVEINDDETGTLDVSLEHVYAISGRVTTTEGAPAVGATVNASWRNDDGEYSSFVTTDEDGIYIAGSPFPVATYVGIAITGPHPPPQRNVKAGRTDVDFVIEDWPRVY